MQFFRFTPVVPAPAVPRLLSFHHPCVKWLHSLSFTLHFSSASPCLLQALPDRSSRRMTEQHLMLSPQRMSHMHSFTLSLRLHLFISQIISNTWLLLLLLSELLWSRHSKRSFRSWLWLKKRRIKHHSDTFSIQSWRFSIKKSLKVFWLLSFPSSFFRQSLPTFLTFPLKSSECFLTLPSAVNVFPSFFSPCFTCLLFPPFLFPLLTCFISRLLARCNSTPHLCLCIPTAAVSLSSAHFPLTFSFSPFHPIPSLCPSSGSWIISWQIQSCLCRWHAHIRSTLTKIPASW